jgi:hypothetical protein
MMGRLALVIPSILVLILAVSVSFIHGEEENFCQQYEVEQQQKWREAGLTETKQRILDLKKGLDFLLDEFNEHPKDQVLKKELLCIYNYWRKLSNLSLVPSVRELSLQKIDEELQQASQKRVEELKQKREKLAQEEREQDYQQWKEASLKAMSGFTQPQIISAVATEVSKSLEQPAWQSNPYSVLYPYNLLRELLGLPRISSVQEIDKNWFEKVRDEERERDYQQWKEAWLKAMSGFTQLQRILAVAADVSKSLEQPEWQSNPYSVLYPYNLLRELLDLPRISSVQEVDKSWLEKVRDEERERDYQQWKEASLKAMSGFTQPQRTLAVATDISKGLEQPEWQSNPYSVLYPYNLLRELLGLPRISSVQEIDKSWLEKVRDEEMERDYQQWKETTLKTMSALTQPKIMSELAAYASKGLEQPEWQSNPYLVLYPYNLLRELLGMPHISSVQEVDKSWLEKVRDEVDIAALVEAGHVKLTPAQKKFIEDEIARLQLTVPLVLVSHTEEQMGQEGYIGTRRYLSVCKDPDLDTRLYILYHELGHIYQSDPAAEEHRASDIKDIQHYLELGWQIIPALQETTVGKHLYSLLDYDNPNGKAKKLLELFHSLWFPTADDVKRKEMIAKRAEERRADLYMLQQLYKQGRMSSILTFIWDYGMSDLSFRNKPWVIAWGDMSHPSDVERALYALGFLVAQGIDVPKVLYDWQTKGICTPVEEEQTTDKEALLRTESGNIV